LTIKNSHGYKPFSIVIAEDDEDDYMLMLEALQKADVNIVPVWVKDGEELMDYLATTMTADGGKNVLAPGIILLDLNMPKKDGWEALKEIKTNKELRAIPVIIFTTSKADLDIALAYDLGVNAFIQKPARFNEYVDVIKKLTQYWFELVTLPNISSR